MVKFTLKTVEYYKNYRHPTDPSNIFLEKYPNIHPAQIDQPSHASKSRVERIKESLNTIKSGPWTKNDYQPEMF